MFQNEWSVSKRMIGRFNSLTTNKKILTQTLPEDKGMQLTFPYHTEFIALWEGMRACNRSCMAQDYSWHFAPHHRVFSAFEGMQPPMYVLRVLLTFQLCSSTTVFPFSSSLKDPAPVECFGCLLQLCPSGWVLWLLPPLHAPAPVVSFNDHVPVSPLLNVPPPV